MDESRVQRGDPVDPKEAYRPGPHFGSLLGPVAHVIKHRPPQGTVETFGVFSATGALLGAFADFQSASLACRAWPQAVSIHPLGTVDQMR